MASNFNPNPSHLPNLPNPHQTKPEKTESAATAAADAKLVINGGSKLSGHVSISGSKNSALSVLAATLCCSGTSKLTNVPDLSDTRTMASILGSLGAEVEFSNHEVVVNADRVGSVDPDPARISGIRGGFFVIGPLLARFGEAVVGLPGDSVISGPGPLISMSEASGSSALWLKSEITKRWHMLQMEEVWLVGDLNSIIPVWELLKL